MFKWINPDKLSFARYYQDSKTQKQPSFLFLFLFHRMIFMNQKEHPVVVWRKLIHKRLRFGHFHAEFQSFWSVGIMTKNAFRLIFFNLFSFFVSQNDSYEPKNTSCDGLEELGP